MFADFSLCFCPCRACKELVLVVLVGTQAALSLLRRGMETVFSLPPQSVCFSLLIPQEISVCIWVSGHATAVLRKSGNVFLVPNILHGCMKFSHWEHNSFYN